MLKISDYHIFLAINVVLIIKRPLVIERNIIVFIEIFILSPKYLPIVSDTLKIERTKIPDHLSLVSSSLKKLNFGAKNAAGKTINVIK
jgi:hypothetical protein